MSTEPKLLTVSEAVASRIACRDYLDKEVPLDLIMKILDEARRAPSSSNLQPWKLYLVHGETKKKLTQIVQKKIDRGVFLDLPVQFPVGPGVVIPAPGVKNEMKSKFPKYYARYSALGKNVYSSQGVPRGDMKKRMEAAFRAFDFFGAPMGLILTIDKGLVLGNYPDLGIMLQTIMLLCQQYGLATCSLVVWSLQHEILRQALNISDNELVFCGMAIGYQNPEAPVNQFKRERVALDEMVVIPQIKDIDDIQFESPYMFKLKMAKLVLGQYVTPTRIAAVGTAMLAGAYWFTKKYR